jgi:PAS domain S-box-containing protein
MPRDIRGKAPSQRAHPKPKPTAATATGAILSARDIESMFAAAPHAMALFDRDGRMVRANRLFHELLALDLLPGISTADPRERVQVFQVRDTRGRRLPATRLPVARALRGDAVIGVAGMQLRVRALDGRELNVQAVATPLSTRAGRVTGCIVVVHDLTITVHTTAQLQVAIAQVGVLSQEAVARVRERDAIFDAIADGLLIYGADGSLQQVNAAARTLLGIPFAEPTGGETLGEAARRLDEFTRVDMHGLPLPRDAWPLMRVLRGETVAGREMADAVRLLPEGREQVLNISAAPVYVNERLVGAVLLLHEVTERRRLERQAAEHASQIEGIFDAMTDGLAFYDAGGGAMRMNAAARRLLGYDAVGAPVDSSFRGGSVNPPMAGKSRERTLPIARPLARVLQGETLTGDRAVDVHVRLPDGREVVLAVSGTPVFDNGMQVVGAVLSMRDVTEQRRSDAARAEVMDIVSHELRTPLSVIAMGVGLVEQRAEQRQPPSLDALEFLADGVAQMTRLINDLIEAARMEVGHLVLRLVPQDLRKLCQSVAREQMQAMQRTITLYLPKQPAIVNIDTARVSQVLANLLSNALKYSAADRPVTLRLGRRSGIARVEVHDEGPGIPPEARAHLFERFYRVPGVKVMHGSGVGLGLGLFIARTLVEFQGGTIDVNSEVGKGSTFSFTLPLLTDTAI